MENHKDQSNENNEGYLRELARARQLAPVTCFCSGRGVGKVYRAIGRLGGPWLEAVSVGKKKVGNSKQQNPM